MGTRLHKRPYAVELSAPVKLFDFDFSRDPADFARRRKVELPCRRRGVLNGVVLHFDLDVDDGDRLSSGAGGDANGAWDQLVDENGVPYFARGDATTWDRTTDRRTTWGAGQEGVRG